MRPLMAVTVVPVMPACSKSGVAGGPRWGPQQPLPAAHALWFWRDAFWATGLTHFNCALRIHGIWGGNCEVPRPRRQLAKLADCLCRYADVVVHFGPPPASAEALPASATW